jgi:AraC-like DNA-binding protein
MLRVDGSAPERSELLADPHVALATAPRPGAFADVVAARIESILPGDPGTDALAAALHMSPRTLQRRLEDEGTRFSEVLDAMRERMARRLVLDDAIARRAACIRTAPCRPSHLLPSPWKRTRTEPRSSTTTMR